MRCVTNPTDPAENPVPADPAPPRAAEQPAGNPSAAEEAAARGKTGEGADSALALLKRRQEARRAMQPRPEDAPEE